MSLKRAPASYFSKRFHRRCLRVFWICLRFWIYQGSKCVSGSKSTSVLNTPFPKYKIFFPLKIRKYFFEKIKKIFQSRFFWEKRAETEKCARLVRNILLLLSKPNWKLMWNKSWESSSTLWICSNKGKLHKLHWKLLWTY